MEATSVTSKGQVTIPKELRERLGIRHGSKTEIAVAGNEVVRRVRNSAAG